MKQMKEWEEYYAVEPWGFKFLDDSHASLCEVVAASGGVTINGKPARKKDFLHGPSEPERELTDAEIERELDRLFGG
jgi:hypothetical protein